ncbi:MAG: PEP-CTERM sorting domain-containing protein [Phycisphaerales bacterium]|nr:PEP-CTERM sorting domain-containing protein [Phycisphaerales bacterium]
MSFIDEGTARANTNTGLFTINSGIVYLNQSSTNTTIVSNIDITDGELSLTQNDQIKDTSAITLTGGTFHTNGKTETVGSILLNASDAKLDGTGGSLTVTGGVDARSGTINTDLVGGTTLAKTTGGTVTVNAGGLVSGDILVEAGLLDYDSTTGITSNVSISGGEMDLATSLGSGGAISVTGGLLSYNGGTELTSISFTSGSIGGSGDVNLGGVTLGSSQTLAPGNSIGSQTISGISELDGATYELEFGLGLAQNNDKLTIEGDVALTALTIDLYTMLDTDTRGNMDGFDQSQNYVWEDVLTITGTVTGTVDNITLDTTNVTDSYSGEFSIVDAGGGAYDLEYNIPEPATMSLLALGGIAMLKRRKK